MTERMNIYADKNCFFFITVFLRRLLLGRTGTAYKDGQPFSVSRNERL